jgi:hypothetical protein
MNRIINTILNFLKTYPIISIVIVVAIVALLIYAC